ncbi:MAG: hypothetical protein IJS15_07235, partial [Victivallales bacterium]|nr:hypothetical protein [Victivallales bacterium]
IHDPTIHDPTIHDPTIHDPTIHDPTIHDPTIHDPTIHDPTIHETSPLIVKLISILRDEETLTRCEIMERLGIKNRDHFIKSYLKPALKTGLIEMTIPDKPQSKNQRYRKKRR